MRAFRGTQRDVITTARDALVHFQRWDDALPTLPAKSALAHTLIVSNQGAHPTDRDMVDALVRLFNHLLSLKAQKTTTIVLGL